MVSDAKIKLGRMGETLAAEFLSRQGVEIVARNVRTAYGELDIVGIVKDMTVTFEVKTRTSEAYGYPEDSISAAKQKHLTESSQAFLQNQPELPADWRIDVVAIRLMPGKAPEIEWFANAVS